MAYAQKSFSEIITFTRASSARYVGSDGLIKVAANNEPRIDYDPATLACLGFLIEESRANLALQSEDWSSASWSKSNVTVTANATAAPDGTMTADTLTATAGSGGTWQFRPVTANTSVYTASVYLRQGTAAQTTVRLEVGASVQVAGATITWAATPTIATLVGTARIVNAGGGWWRVSLTAANTNQTQVGMSIAAAHTLTGSVIAWGAQIEQGNGASSYIPTTTASVTRSSDVTTISTASPWYQRDGGYIYCEFQNTSGLAANGISRPYAFTTDGGAANCIYADINATLMQVTVGTNNITQSVRFVGVTLGALTKSAIRIKDNSVILAVNGSLSALDDIASMPPINSVLIGHFFSRQLNGHLRKLAYMPSWPTDEQLRAMTA